MPQFKVGIGYDVHKLVYNRDLIIGGVTIPHYMGLLGHSDADVLLHAIIDALLGAASKGDIGLHFPCNDPKFENISSLKLLFMTHEILKSNGYTINNIDSTIVAQNPKLNTYTSKMIDKISTTLHIPNDIVNIKATTEESLGFTGREEGISAHAICSIISS